MNRQDIYSLLRKLGMTEYESKIYMAAIRLKTASPIEIQNITNIPRGKVYETLSSLTEKGYLEKITDKRRIRYNLANTDILFRKIKNDNILMIDKLNESIKKFGDETPESKTVKVFELYTFWGIKNHTQMIIKRAGSEIIILSNDDNFFENYAEDVIEASKRLNLYLIVPNSRTKKPLPVPCYHGGKDIDNVFFNPKNTPVVGREIKTTIYCDQNESLSVFYKDKAYSAVIISKGYQVQYITKKILEEIKPMEDS